jgi:hypothetical protein
MLFKLADDFLTPIQNMCLCFIPSKVFEGVNLIWMLVYFVE